MAISKLGQGHGSSSHSGSNILITSLTFHVSRHAYSWDKTLLKFDLENQRSRSWVKRKFEVTPIPSIACYLSLPFQRYHYFKLCPSNSGVNVNGEARVQGHIVGETLYQLISLLFRVYLHSYSCDTAISIFYHENPRSRSWMRSKFKVAYWIQHLINSHPFCCMSVYTPIPNIGLFKNLPWKSKVKVMEKNHVNRHLKIWPWKSKVKVMRKVKVQSHIVDPTAFFFWLGVQLQFSMAYPWLRKVWSKTYHWLRRISWSWAHSYVILRNFSLNIPLLREIFLKKRTII